MSIRYLGLPSSMVGQRSRFCRVLVVLAVLFLIGVSADPCDVSGSKISGQCSSLKKTIEVASKEFVATLKVVPSFKGSLTVDLTFGSCAFKVDVFEQKGVNIKVGTIAYNEFLKIEGKEDGVKVRDAKTPDPVCSSLSFEAHDKSYRFPFTWTIDKPTSDVSLTFEGPIKFIEPSDATSLGLTLGAWIGIGCSILVLFVLIAVGIVIAVYCKCKKRGKSIPKPIVAKSSELQLDKTQPSEEKPAKTKPIEDKPAEVKPDKTHQSEDKPAKSKTMDDKSTEVKPLPNDQGEKATKQETAEKVKSVKPRSLSVPTHAKPSQEQTLSKEPATHAKPSQEQTLSKEPATIEKPIRVDQLKTQAKPLAVKSKKGKNYCIDDSELPPKQSDRKPTKAAQDQKAPVLSTQQQSLLQAKTRSSRKVEKSTQNQSDLQAFVDQNKQQNAEIERREALYQSGKKSISNKILSPYKLNRLRDRNERDHARKAAENKQAIDLNDAKLDTQETDRRALGEILENRNKDADKAEADTRQAEDAHAKAAGSQAKFKSLNNELDQQIQNCGCRKQTGKLCGDCKTAISKSVTKQSSSSSGSQATKNTKDMTKE